MLAPLFAPATAMLILGCAAPMWMPSSYGSTAPWLTLAVAAGLLTLAMIGIMSKADVQATFGKSEVRYGFHRRQAAEWFAADNHTTIWQPEDEEDGRPST